MSTKSSIAYGPNFHFYHEAFEQDAVYLELDRAFFDASPDKVTVAIPVVVWEVIRQYGGADLSWATKSDEEIRQWVENEVDERIARNLVDSPSLALLRTMGAMTFGPASDAREAQIESGLAYGFEKRDQQRDLLARIDELKAAQR
ncbi:MAG: hypothetical protein ACXV7J_16435 [Methylomonas sp.]